ncbi:hypothetical protein [Microbispora rosea]|uniref:hypothetical protein n=2 Tax=Microbispora rosea TaxID=58117 RepID=UPI00117E182B|nr:hypothetical protein [Microbispora rosea]
MSTHVVEITMVVGRRPGGLGGGGRIHPLGRAVSRVLAALLLAAYSTAPLALAVDLGINRSCLGVWGGPEGATLFLRGDTAPMPAALCILATLGLLALLPAADL